MAQDIAQFKGNSVAKSPASNLNAFLQKHKNQLALALPKHLNADRMVRLALTSVSQNKALAECDVNSVFASLIVASQLGLEIGVAGQAYLVPYKGKAQCIPGWQGLVDLVSRSGRATVWTGAVFEGDDFDYALGDKPHVTHRPGGEDDWKKMTHVYAIGRVNGSEFPVIEVWPVKRVWKHRDKQNKVGNAHYSHNYPEMYARKVVLLQVLKYMPKSIELNNAIDITNASDEGRGVTIEGSAFVIDDGDQNDQQHPQQAQQIEHQQSHQVPPSDDFLSGMARVESTTSGHSQSRRPQTVEMD